MLEPITNGGPLIWLLMLCSLVGLGVFAERFFYYHRASVDISDLLGGLRNLVRKKQVKEALSEASITPGPAARVIHAVLQTVSLAKETPRDELRHIAQEAGQLEVPRLERYLGVLSMIAFVAPLIGLLGTIVGLYQTFSIIAEIKGDPTASDISRGVYQALVTSAVGLAIAIPAHVLHGYLASHVRNLMHEMERAGIEIINIVCDARREKGIIEFQAELREEQEPGMSLEALGEALSKDEEKPSRRSGSSR